MKKDPGSVKWGGGSRGSTEHIAAAMLAREVGVDAAKINYVPFRGGGEAVAAILGGNVTVGGSGYSEFQQYIESGKMRAIAVTSPKRLKGINIPTMIEQGYNIDIGNWRGVYAPAGLTTAPSQNLGPSLSRKTTGHLHGWPTQSSTTLWIANLQACAPPWSSQA
jgi:putative tricarboxylic transport membrane protein